MLSPDERYVTVGELKQGAKFTYKNANMMVQDNQFMVAVKEEVL